MWNCHLCGIPFSFNSRTQSPFCRYLSELREIRSANLDSRGVISNPINAFHMMRRLTIGWREVKTTLEFHGNVTGKIDDFNFIQFIRTEFGNNPNFILFYLFMYFFFQMQTLFKMFLKFQRVSQMTRTCRERHFLWLNCREPIDWTSAN
jgi:hypothetical protein